MGRQAVPRSATEGRAETTEAASSARSSSKSSAEGAERGEDGDEEREAAPEERAVELINGLSLASDAGSKVRARERRSAPPPAAAAPA